MTKLKTGQRELKIKFNSVNLDYKGLKVVNGNR